MIILLLALIAIYFILFLYPLNTKYDIKAENEYINHQAISDKEKRIATEVIKSLGRKKLRIKIYRKRYRNYRQVFKNKNNKNEEKEGDVRWLRR